MEVGIIQRFLNSIFSFKYNNMIRDAVKSFVVRDEQHTFFVSCQRVQQLLQRFLIEVIFRFIQNEKIRVFAQRTKDFRLLCFSAGQVADIRIAILQPICRHQIIHTCCVFCVAASEKNVFPYAHITKERRTLCCQADRGESGVFRAFSVNPYLTGRCIFKAADTLDKCGFSTSVFAFDQRYFVPRYTERKIFKNGLVCIFYGQVSAFHDILTVGQTFFLFGIYLLRSVIEKFQAVIQVTEDRLHSDQTR